MYWYGFITSYSTLFLLVQSQISGLPKCIKGIIFSIMAKYQNKFYNYRAYLGIFEFKALSKIFNNVLS